jgi:hypothetical protein
MIANAKKSLFGLLLCMAMITRTSLSAEDIERIRHTISVTALPPFIPMYNIGIAYDYYLLDAKDNFSISTNLAAKTGVLNVLPSADNLSSYGNFIRADIIGKLWWNIRLRESFLGFFFGFGGAYVGEKIVLSYEPSGRSSTDVASQNYSRILPAYNFGAAFRPSENTRWCFGLTISGVFGGKTDIDFQLPGSSIMQSKEVSSRGSVLIEFSVGYSF